MAEKRVGTHMHRFFLEGPAHGYDIGETISLPDELAHQIRDVLHLTHDEQLVLFDQSGNEFLCHVIKAHRSGVEVQIDSRQRRMDASVVQVILCQGMLKSARFEWILEKGTELGVVSFLPIQCRRSIAGLDGTGPTKIQRWQRIIKEAAEQCGRTQLPELLPACSLQVALKHIPAGAMALMPWEEEKSLTLRAVLRSSNLETISNRVNPLTVVLFIGPEGGLAEDEVRLAEGYGVRTVSLGSRILRAETAAIAAVANVMYELEDAKKTAKSEDSLMSSE